MRTRQPEFRLPRAARLSPLAAAFALAFALAPAAHAITITVTSDLDDLSGGTLRDAILAANAACDTGVSTVPVINFSGPFTIAPSSPLPTFFCGSATYNPSIDGGGTPTAPRVVLDGAASSASCGLNSNVNPFYGGSTLTVLGMKIANFAYGSFAAGVCGTNVTLKGNLFTGNSIGAWLTGGSSTVGGPLAADRNVFASSPGKGLQVSGPATATIENNVFTGNSDTGLYVSGGSATIQDNLVGTANGATANGNGTGIYLSSYPYGSSITGNVISGNDTGIYVYSDYGGSTISNNKIGTNTTGSTALANTAGGVVVQYSRGLSISGNHISGNGNAGIAVNGSSIDIIGNRIGSDSGGGTLPNTRGIDASCSGINNLKIEDNEILTNLNEGIFLSIASFGGSAEIERNNVSDNGGTGLRIDGTSCGYGGSSFVADGTFANNGVDGILLVSSNTVGNTISANSIYGNGRKNINLNGGSTTLPNDSLDSDGGANNQQNWPVINSVIQSGGQTLVSFTLESSSYNDLEIQAFSNSSMGKPAGEIYQGSMTLCGDCSEYSGTLTLDGLYDNISLTATDIRTSFVDADTSEFSPMKAAITAPAATVSPDFINFGDLLVGTQSPARNSLVRSIGDQPFVIAAMGGGSCYGGPICYGGAFICTTTCEPGNAYTTDQFCKITATFAPPLTSFPSFYQTTIYICDNSSASPHTLLLQGNAILPPPLTITPTAWDFGDVLLGASSELKKFTILNRSDSIVSIQNVSTTGEFDLLDTTCVEVVFPGASCNAVVAFVPTQSGEANGAVVVEFNENCNCEFRVDGIAQIGKADKVGATLKGNGLAGGQLTLPEAIEVGAAVVGGGAISRTVELRNTGISPVTISEITVSAPFTLVNNCTAPLEAGAACTLVIGFTAPGVGSFNGTLTVVSDAAAGSAAIPVHATGQTSAAPLLVIQPSSIGFGDRVIGSQTLPQQVTITNIGGAAASLSLSTSTIDFVIAGNGCGATLASQATCFAQMAFRPLGFGLRLGALVVTSNATGSPQGVSLSGTGCRPFIASGNRLGSPDSNCAP